MKILHTSDWHIGKIVHGQHMTQDQAYILDEMIGWIREQAPDVIVMAGDLYDRSIPPVEAVELVDRTLSAIVYDLKIPVIAIAGNHDSPGRLDFGHQLMEKQGLYIRGNIEAFREPIVLEDCYGPVYFFPIPYTEPIAFKHLLQDETIVDHQTAMVSVMGQIKDIMDQAPENARFVCIAHGYLTGASDPEDSVRPLSIGGTEQIQAELFKDFHYVALGHLHGQQKVGSERIRYSGSLMKYSFSEARQKKSFTLVTLDEAGEVEIACIPLKAKRDMRILEGKLEDLMSETIRLSGNREDYLMARLTDDGALYEPMQTLRQIYPNMLKLEHIRQGNTLETEDGKKLDVTEKSPMTWLDNFLGYIEEGELDEDLQGLSQEIFKTVLKKERER